MDTLNFQYNTHRGHSCDGMKQPVDVDTIQNINEAKLYHKQHKVPNQPIDIEQPTYSPAHVQANNNPIANCHQFTIAQLHLTTEVYRAHGVGLNK